MGFFAWRDGTPVKPGFLRSRLPVYLAPEGVPDTSREACCWMAVARRAPDPGFTKIDANGGAEER
jgi:hypothetical protein